MLLYLRIQSKKHFELKKQFMLKNELPFKKTTVKLNYSFQNKMDLNEAKKILNLPRFYSTWETNTSFKQLLKTFGNNKYVFLKIREAKKICDETTFLQKLGF